MDPSSRLLVRQRLGFYGVFFGITFIHLITPMSMDMYIPAIPLMTEYFAASEMLVNMTLTGYFIVFAIGLLFAGSLSDKLGRRPILIFGTICYTIGTVICALSLTIWMLIFARLVQAIGGSVMGSVATACIKDCFVPQSRAKVFAIGQAVFTLGPVLAPIIGGFILNFASWREMFWTLAIIGILSIVFAFLYQESLPFEERSQKSTLQTLGNMGHVLKIKGFVPLLLVSSWSSATYMGYVTLSSYIFEDHYGYTAQEFSYFFAATALLTALGPVIYLRLCKRAVTPRVFTHFVVGALAACSILLVPFGSSGALVFFGLFAVIALCQMTFKAYITNALISEVKVESEVGSASSLMNFVGVATGCTGMLMASMEIGSSLTRFIVIAVIFGTINLATWIFYCLQKYQLYNLEHVIEEQK